MEKVTEQQIEFYKERKEARLSKEYFKHREKRINDLIDLEKNFELVKQINEISKEKEDDINLKHSKKVVLEYCLEKFKSIKKEDIEIEEFLKILNNNKSTIEKTVELEDKGEEVDLVHEEIEQLLKRIYKKN